MTRPASTPPRVLVLQHAAEEGPGAIAAALRARALEPRVVHPYRGDPVPEAPGAFAGVVALGGPMDVRDAGRLPYLSDEIDLLRAATRAGVPVLGVCLGSQLLAAALGARVRAAPQMELGFSPVTLRPEAAADPLLTGAPTTFPALHWHSDVFDLPDGALSLASSAPTEHQAFRYGDAAYGFLFHLEIDRPTLAAMLEACADEVRAAGRAPADLLAEADRHLPSLRRAAGHLFDRWAALAAARHRPAEPTPGASEPA